MAIPKISKQDVIKALQYIAANGIPSYHQSVKYDLVTEDGKKYPVKYVVAVANHLANGEDIVTTSFHVTEARAFLQEQGFHIEMKQEKYELIITANEITSTDERFTMNDLGLGDHYKPLDIFFCRSNGETIKRSYGKGERRNSNQTLPRLACQVFEKQLAALSMEERESFPICQYKPTTEVVRGIYRSLDEFRRHRKTIEYLTYNYDNDRQFVFYCWNMFSRGGHRKALRDLTAGAGRKRISGILCLSVCGLWQLLGELHPPDRGCDLWPLGLPSQYKN